MDNLGQTFTDVFGVMADIYMVAAAFVYPYKVAVFLVILVGLVIGRFIEANTLKRRRTDKRDWIVSGILLAAHLITLFIHNSWIWLTIELLVVCVQVFYINAFNEAKDVKGIIYKSNIVYEDHSDAHSTGISSEEKAEKRARDARIKRSILFTQVMKALYMPIFAQRFSCKLEVSLRQDDVAQVLKGLQDTFKIYAWEYSMSKNQQYIQFTCRLKGKTKTVVPFNEELSEKLPWYAVPIGVSEITSKKAMDASPHVWLLDDPKKESYEIPELKDTHQLEPFPHLAITGSSGGGKAHPVDTPIFVHTKHGIAIKTMRELKVGDKVFNRYGEPVKVIGVYPQGNKDVYEISTSDNRTVLASQDHRFITATKSHGRIKEQVLTTQNMLDDVYYAKNKHEYKKHKYWIPRNKALKTNDTLLPLDPWLLGFLIGDGCFTEKSSITISTADEYIVNKTKEIVKLYGCNLHRTKGNSYNYIITPFRNIEKHIVQLNLRGCYSQDKFIPKTYLAAGTEQRLALLQGLMDADGSIETTGKGLQYSTISLQLAKDVLQLAISLGFAGRITTDKRKKYINSKGTAYRVRLTGYSYCPFTLPRKAERWNNKVDKRATQTISYKTKGNKKDWLVGYLWHTVLQNKDAITLNRKFLPDNLKEDILHILPKGSFISEYSKRNYRIHISDKAFENELEIPHYLAQSEREIPNKYLGNLAFIQGYLDSVGKYYLHTGKMHLYCHGKLINSTKQLLSSVNLSYLAYGEEIIIPDCPESIISNDNTRVAIREWEQEKEIKFRDKYIPITSIKHTGKQKEMICIKVDCPSHSYTLANGIVSHNSIALMAVLAHFIKKAKKPTHEVELYLADGKSMGFLPYKNLKEVKSVTTDLVELAKQTEEFKEEMIHNQKIFGVEGMDQGLPLDNHVNLKKSVALNGHLFLKDEVFEYKDKSGNIKKDKAENLVGRDDIVEINIPSFAKQDDEEEKRPRRFFNE